MKRVLLIIGILFSVLSLISIFQFSIQEDQINQFESGFLWGKIIMLVFGLVLVYLGLRKKKWE